MKQTKLKLSFKARLELFFIKLPMEWRLRKVYGFKIFSMLKELFFPKKVYVFFG